MFAGGDFFLEGLDEIEIGLIVFPMDLFLLYMYITLNWRNAAKSIGISSAAKGFFVDNLNAKSIHLACLNRGKPQGLARTISWEDLKSVW